MPRWHILAVGATILGLILIARVLQPEKAGRSAQRPPDPAADLVKLGRELLERHELAAAHAAFTRAADADSLAVDAQRGLAAVAYDQGALMRAVGHLERVAALDPGDSRPWRMIGHICRDLDRHERAVASYREALARGLPPRVAAEVRVELAEELLALGDAAAALEALPADAPGWEGGAATALVRAEALWMTAGVEAGLAAVTPAAEVVDAGPEVLSLLGRLRVDAGLWEAAVDPLERATSGDPADLAALEALAVACERSGRAADAAGHRARRAEVQAALERLSALGRTADADPWDAAVRDELAALCGSLGKRELGVMWRQAADQARARISAREPRPP